MGKDIADVLSTFMEKKGIHTFCLKAVLFDMDGVLFDSMKNHTLAWYKAVTAVGIPCEREEFYHYEGATAKWTIDTLLRRAYGREATEEEVIQLYDLKSKYFNELPEAVVMPRARILVQQVKEAGLTPVLVTGSGQRSLLGRLEREFPGIFAPETMVTAFDVKRGKPDPEPYCKGLEKAGVASYEAMIVENAPLGVKAGVAAGIFTIAVNTGPIPDEQLLEAGADLLFPDMQTFAQGGFPEILRLLSDDGGAE